jgi:hypothetical protein
MDTLEKGWRENREDYLKKAYTAVRFSGGSVPLGEAVENWENSTDASRHYFWKALGLFRLSGDLDVEEQGGQTILDIDPSVELSELEEDVELVPGEGQNVRQAENDAYREFEGFQAPVVPTFLAWEHLDRHADEVFTYEDPEMRGVVGHETTSQGTEETWLGFYNHDGREEGSTWINQVFRGLELEDDGELLSTEDVFTDRNRESYTDTIWESRPMKIRQRAHGTWEAAVEAVEEKVPQLKQNYLERVEKQGWQELDEFDLVKREFRLMAGEDEYDEENPAYIEQIAHDYYGDGLRRDSELLQPFLENIESTPYEEGDMNLGEATRGSDTSDAKKQRNQAYMSHYLDLVWQLSQERYAE